MNLEHLPITGADLERRDARNLLRLALAALAALGLLGVSSAVHAAAITITDPFLRYINVGPNTIGQASGELIGYGATSVVPNGPTGGTTGTSTTINLATGNTITRTIFGTSEPATPNFFNGSLAICTTNCTSTGDNNPLNLQGSWTLTFNNASTNPTSASAQLSLAGAGEIPFVNSVTLSGTSAAPTFSWSPPAGVPVDGYRINIFQNSLVTPSNDGQVTSANVGPTTTSYTVQPSDFTIPGTMLQNNTTYTIQISILQTRDGSTTNFSNSNVSAISRVFSTFQTLPTNTPPVNLPTTTLVGNQVIYGFNLTVKPGITYYIDPEVATGYIYRTGSGDPNFASVELPDIGNPNPYDLYLWNGSAFVFDTTLAADTIFDFAPGGVSEFEVLGIDSNLGLDPNNTTAFITALTFESAGNFTGTMTPVTTNVPEPGSLALLASSSLLGLGLTRRRRAALPETPTFSI